MTVKERIRGLIDDLPDDVTWAQAMAKLRASLEGGLTPKQQALEKQGLLRRPEITDPEERKRVLREVVERMKANPIPEGAPRRFTRDELHERR
jgi:hypothetical protein